MSNLNLNSQGDQTIGGDAIGHNKLNVTIINNYLTPSSASLPNASAAGEGVNAEKHQASNIRPSVKSGYFYHENLLGGLLYEQDLSLQEGNEFIKPSEFLNPKYYPGRYKSIIENRSQNQITLELPYQERVSFLDEPNAEIEIINEPTPHVMRDDFERITLNNLRAFREKNRKSDDWKLARLVYFRKVDEYKYQCCLEESGYFTQARTNLTIDYPIKIKSSRRSTTLRQVDMDFDNNLKPLEQSILANTLGVSAVVFYRNENGFYFFNKYRENQSVFKNILGTLSCVVGPPPTDQKNLIAHLKNQLCSAFKKEVGLDTATIVDMRPLAFSLELIRGGKPQFFFVIEVKENGNFTEEACRDVEKTRRFVEVLQAKRGIEKRSLSPEFIMNLVYAFKYLQTK